MKTAIGARDEVAFIKAFEQGSAVTSGEMQSIKLALSALRASHEVAEPVKQEADQLFHKLNGQLFMQQDHPSYSQIVMSFPKLLEIKHLIEQGVNMAGIKQILAKAEAEPEQNKTRRRKTNET